MLFLPCDFRSKINGKMLLIIWILICMAGSIKYCNCHRIDETLTKFVVNVTLLMYSPSTVTAFLCVDNENGFRFTKQMSRNHVMNDLWRSIEDLDPQFLSSRIHQQNFFVLDLDCPGAFDILIKANESRMFRSPSQWLILQDLRSTKKSEIEESRTVESLIDGDDVSWIQKIFSNLTMFPDSKIILGRRMNNNLFRVLSSYRPSPKHELILEDRGYWTPDGGLIFRNRLPDSRRRQNLRKTELKSCLVITNPDTFNHLDDYEDNLVDAVTKANYPWILHLANRMNATVTFTSENTWGYREKNGSWNGMIGTLVRREIDLGGTATFFVPERVGVVEYVQLYTPTGSRFVFRRPPLSYVSNLFTLPFGRNVWITIGLFIILFIGILYLAMKWEFKIQSIVAASNSQVTPIIDGEPSISNDCLVVLGAVSQQGSAYEPRAIATRIIVLVLLLAALSLYTSYTANIVALLQSTADSINTLGELMNSSLKIGIFDTVYNRYYFPAFQDPERKEFYENVVKGKKDVWMGLEEGIREVRKGLFAFHVDISASYQVIQETFDEGEKCGIHEINFLKMLNPLLVVQYQSPYLEIIRVGALWIHETGLQYREISRLYRDKPVCQGTNSFVSVGITECHAAYVTMAYGVSVAFGILLFEIILHKWITFSNLKKAAAEMSE